MSNYVVVNLADRSGMGAISSLHHGISEKQSISGLSSLFKSNSIDLVDAFPLLDADLLKQLPRTDPALQVLRKKCLESKKIYLATHGLPTDVDHAFAKSTGGAPLCTVDQFAKFVLLMLPERDKVYNLALVMCYGGRTLNYRAANLDHQGNIPIADLRTSFAYKLYSRIAQARNVRMTARTGAVAFDSKTGVSSVEDELSIDARVDKEAFLRQGHIVPTVTAFKSARANAASQGGPALMQFDQLKTAFEKDPNKKATNPVETVLKNYADMMRTKQQYVDIMEANADKTKYGKLVYTFIGGQLSIISKYANNGGSLSLYNGPMT